MKRKLAVILPIIMSLTACTDSSPETKESVTEAMTEALSEITAVSEVFSEIEITSQTTEYRTTEHTERETEAETFADSEEALWQALYREKLFEIRESEYFEPSVSTFDLFDVDCDGIPEHFAAYGSYHVAGVFVYTVRNGEVIQLCTPDKEYFGSWGTTEVNDKGFLASRYFGMGSDYTDYFRLENGQLTLMVSSEHHMCFPDESGEEPDKFVIDGNEVSEEEYNEATQKYNAMNWTDVGQSYRFFDMDDAEKVIDNYGK